MKVDEYRQQMQNNDKKALLIQKKHENELIIQSNKIQDNETTIKKLQYDIELKKKAVIDLNEKIMNIMDENKSYRSRIKDLEYDTKIEIEKFKDNYKAKELNYKSKIATLNKKIENGNKVIIKLKSIIMKKDNDINMLHEEEVNRMKELETSINNCIRKKANDTLS